MKPPIKCDICHLKLKKNNLLFLNPPQKRELKVKWNRALKCKLKDDAKVCQNHFDPADISFVESNGKKRIRLRKRSIPFLAEQQDPAEERRKRKKFAASKIQQSQEAEDTDNGNGMATSPKEQNFKTNQLDLLSENFCDVNSNDTEKLIYTITRNNLEVTRSVETNFVDGRICGLIKVQPTDMLYVFCCFYCNKTFALENLATFTQHIQEQHLAQDAIADQSNQADQEEGETIFDVSVQSDTDIDCSDDFLDFEPVMKESLKEKKVKRRQYGTGNKANTNKTNVTVVNVIHMDEINSKMYLEFIDQFENHPLLWYPPQDSEEYMEAISALTEELNELWETKLKSDDVDASLRHLKEFYYKNLILNNSSDNLEQPFKQYFEKCNKFLPDLDLCRFQKAIVNKDKQAGQKSQMQLNRVQTAPMVATIATATNVDQQSSNINSRTQLSQFKRKQVEYCCETCGKKYKNVTKYKNHVSSHTYRHNYLCHICGATFYSEDVHKTHLKRHSGSLQCVCKICDLVFRESPRLADHRKKCHFVLEGTVEELDERRRNIMERRVNRGAVYQSLHVDPVTKVKYFMCNMCDETFRKYSKLYFHKIRKHDYKTDRMLREKGTAALNCEICNKKLSNQMSYNTHKKRHFGLTHCQCKICRLYFRESPRLTAHRKKCHFVLEGTVEELSELENMLLHLTPQSCKPMTNPLTGSKIYACSQCQLTFEQQNILLLHKIRDHGLKASITNKKFKHAFSTVEDLMLSVNKSDEHVHDHGLDQEIEVQEELEEYIEDGEQNGEMEILDVNKPEVSDDEDETAETIEEMQCNDEAESYEEIVQVEDVEIGNDCANNNVAVIHHPYSDNIVVYPTQYYYT